MEKMKMKKSESKETTLGVAIHRQVRKIKQESEKFAGWEPDQPEIRHLLPEITPHRLSPSPLGISAGVSHQYSH
ncbi:hypothetical protein G2W53_034479 [Senna tora]|uniref:Uncharacterized protein n=1 Tax=Senna tora TaxID=362788 RepID=A0A834SZD3_9FABA|nr:hypothetical protein G2W53_034479 [Senna tora]